MFADGSIVLAQVILYELFLNWLPIYLIGYIAAIVIIFGQILLPESPSYLIETA